MKYVKIITDLYEHAQTYVVYISGYLVFGVTNREYRMIVHFLLCAFSSLIYVWFVGPAIAEYLRLSDAAQLFCAFVFGTFSVYFYTGVIKFFRRWADSPVELIRAIIGKGK